MRFVQLCLYTGKQGQCLKVVAGLLPRPHPAPPLPGPLTALWRGRQAQGRPCGRGRLGPGDHRRLPDTEMSDNGNHLSPLSPSFLSSLISSQSSPTEHTAGFFFKTQNLSQQFQKKSFLIKLQIVLSYFKGNGQLEQLIKGIIIK